MNWLQRIASKPNWRPLINLWAHISRERFLRGAFWGVAGAVGGRVLALGTSVIVARLLGKHAFGQWGMVQNTVGLFGMLAGAGLGLTATKSTSEFRATDPAKVGRILSLCLVVGIVSGAFVSAAMVFAAPRLAARTLADPGMAVFLQLGAALVLLNALNGVQAGALVGFEAFKRTAQITQATGLISCLLITAATLLYGLKGAVIGLVGTAAANAILNHLALRAELQRAGVRCRIAHCKSEWRLLFSFSLPALASGLLASPVNWLCAAILVNRPNGYAEMALWNVANQWFYAVLFFPNALSSNAIPVLSEQLAKRDILAARRTLKTSLQLNAIIVLPLVLLSCVASPYLMAMYGKGFQPHWPVLEVAFITGGILAMQIPVGQVIVASGRLWLLTCIQIIWALVYCFTVWLLPSYGALGVVCAQLLAWALHTIITLLVARKILTLRPFQASSTLELMSPLSSVE